MFQSLRETPCQEEHVELEDQVHEKRYYKCSIQTRESQGTKSTRNRSRSCRICGGCRRIPELATIVTFPCDVILSALKFNYHDDSSHSGNHNYERPEKIGDSNPNIRSIGQSEHAYDRNNTNAQPDTSVDLPFRVIEE